MTHNYKFGNAERQQWHSAFSNQPPFSTLYVISNKQHALSARVYTKNSFHFCLHHGGAGYDYPHKETKKMFRLLIFTQIIHPLHGSEFVEMLS